MIAYCNHVNFSYLSYLLSFIIVKGSAVSYPLLKAEMVFMDNYFFNKSSSVTVNTYLECSTNG